MTCPPDKNNTPTRPSLSVDWEAYATMLEDSDMPLDQQQELIETLWSIVVMFVDLGYDIKPVPQICGEDQEALDRESADLVSLLHNEWAQKVTDMLNRVIYAGYIEHEQWGITRRQGHHQALISLETYQTIQERRNSKGIAAKRPDISKDFPLRGSVNCACCDKPMTAYWSRSATGKRYPYYNCQTRDCSEYRKSIRAEKIDDGFENILRSMTPSKNMLDIAISMLKDAWDQRGDQAKQAKAEIRRQHKELDKQQDALVERMVETSNPKVMSALETKIAKLEEDKLLLTDKLSQNTKPKSTLSEIIELLRDFLSNPWNIYENGSLLVKKTILKTAFKAPLAYDRQNGYRTPQVSVIFDFLADFTSKCEMVPPHGHAKQEKTMP